MREINIYIFQYKMELPVYKLNTKEKKYFRYMRQKIIIIFLTVLKMDRGKILK